MENFSKKKKELIILTALVIFIILSGLYIYNATYYITVRFNELGALTKNMAVYYNGFKVGKIVHIGPDKDFKRTLARINLTRKDTNLPQNATVKVQSFPNGELYLMFVYPQSPSLKILKRGDVIEGIAKYSLEEFMLGQSISGVSDLVSLHVIKALNAMDIANKEMEGFFRNSSKILQENNKGIKKTIDNTAAMMQNFAQMAENLKQASKKINDALDETELKDTTSNIKDAAVNIAKATEDIDKTMQKIDDTIYQANATAENLNAISNGLKETLSQKFAGMRIIFGTPVKQEKYRHACK